MFVVASKSNPNLETHINPTLTLALCGPYIPNLSSNANLSVLVLRQMSGAYVCGYET